MEKRHIRPFNQADGIRPDSMDAACCGIPNPSMISEQSEVSVWHPAYN
jgi:hypothetical protein